MFRGSQHQASSKSNTESVKSALRVIDGE